MENGKKNGKRKKQIYLLYEDGSAILIITSSMSDEVEMKIIRDIDKHIRAANPRHWMSIY